MASVLLGFVVIPAVLIPLLALPLLHGERRQGDVLVQLGHCDPRFEERDRDVAISFDLIPQPVTVLMTAVGQRVLAALIDDQVLPEGWYSKVRIELFPPIDRARAWRRDFGDERWLVDDQLHVGGLAARDHGVRIVDAVHDVDLHVRREHLSLIHISEPTRLLSISYAV